MVFASWLGIICWNSLTTRTYWFTITYRIRTSYVHRYPLDRCAQVILLQLTSCFFYWIFSCNTLGTVNFPICCFSFSSVFTTPRCPSLAPLWSSFNTPFILEEGTTKRLHEVLSSVLSQYRYKHPFIHFKLSHRAQYAFVRMPSAYISFLVLYSFP